MTLKDIISKNWNGEERLWKVFWLYGVLANILFALVAAAVMPDQGIDIGAGFGLFLVVFAVSWLVYMVWNLVSQWRCAWNATWVGWGYIVRVLVILDVARMVAYLFGVQ